MDTSEIYIKMCAKAEEIQTTKAQYFQSHGNFFADNITSCPTWLISCDICFNLTKSPERFIWLPRQDQLQGMITIARNSGELLDLFVSFLLHAEPNYSKLYSMEQLWLAFVMKEKYNKTWNGEDWIK